MKLTIDRMVLVNAFKSMSTIVGNDPSFTNSTSFIILSPSDNGINIMGTDSAASISLDIPSKTVEDFTEPVLLPFGMVAKIVGKCVSDDVSFKSDGKMSDNGLYKIVSMTAGNCRLKLQSLPVSEYPQISFDAPDATTVSIQIDDAVAGIDKTSVAISENTLDRQELRGTLFEKDAGVDYMHFVATNGYQMSYYKVDLDPSFNNVSFRATFPVKYTNTIVKLLESHKGSAELRFTGNKIYVFTDGFKFSTNINERQFPDWHRLLLDRNIYDATVTLDTHEFLETIERVGSVTDDNLGSFAMGLKNGTFHFSAQPSNTAFHITDDIAVKHDGGDVYFSCNHKFFIKVLRKVAGDEIVVLVGHAGSDPTSDTFLPVIIEDGNYTNMILPLRGLPSHE